MSRAVVIAVVLVGAVMVLPVSSAEDAGRSKVRLLTGFESSADARAFLARPHTENCRVDIVQDYGVTEGRSCARITIPKGKSWGSISLPAEMIRNWSDFDYFSMDLYTEDSHPYRMVFELWDRDSRDFHTRSTQENQRTHPGKQTLMWPINRAKRNNKEGRSWGELEPQDKIDMDHLRYVKIFTTPRKDRDAVFWVDNLQLMQEDAAKPKMHVPLPQGAIAFDFGSPGAGVRGFKAVSATTAYPTHGSPAGVTRPGDACGFLSTKGLRKGGKGWPDLLTGTFVYSPAGEVMRFRASVPAGEYLVWLSAGKVIRPEMQDPRYLLKVNDTVIVEETPARKEFCSAKYLYRFMWTQYSEKEHAVWHNYLSRMYPVEVRRVRVTDGVLDLETQNHFLSALILLPADRQADFESMASDIERRRIEAYYKTLYIPSVAKPQRREGDGDYLLYVPDLDTTVGPSTGPSDEERARTGIEVFAGRGQRVAMRLAVVPFEDLGRCTLELGDLHGPGVIRTRDIRGYFKNYRSKGAGAAEMALMPSLTLDVEKGVTQVFYLWMLVPKATLAGTYKGAFTFKPGRGEPQQVPVTVKVYPFALEQVLPVSFGMYGGGQRRNPSFPPEVRKQKLLELIGWMKEIGFTAISVGGPGVLDVDLENRKVSLSFPTSSYELAEEAGLGKHPAQMMMGTALGTARAIGRRMPGSRGARVDQDPGIELRQPGFRECCLDAFRQYAEFIERTGLPVAVEVVDEPREVPNPWNRNLADTIAYADMLHQAGVKNTFVTPMGDTQSGLDYTGLIDHVDIVSTHATPGSRKFMTDTRKKGKTLWLYNTGKDRFSWGFYNWRAGSKGRWEWHFSWTDSGADGGYPGAEWYNPFTGMHGLALNAPYHEHRGGILFQSAYLDIAEGITDYAYVYSLEQAIAAHKRAAAKPETVKRAEEFLSALKRAIPAFPQVKGLASPEDGALVGMGIEDEARLMVDQWRREIAELLADFAE